MSEREHVPVETRSRTLSLAVKPVDAVTGRRAAGRLRVAVEGVDSDPVENRSGYYLFFGLSPGTVTVTVDGFDRYRDARRDVDLAALDPKAPTETVELTPATAYRFPTGSTLVRGFVRDADGDGVPGATVSVVDWGRSAVADDAGEFVLWFDPVTAADVTESDGRRLVTVGDGIPRLAVATDGAPATITAATVDGEAVPLDDDGDDGPPGNGRPGNGPPGNGPPDDGPPGDDGDGSDSVPVEVEEGTTTTCELVIQL